MTLWGLISTLLAFVVAALLTRNFSSPVSRLYLLDHPNERSLHTHPTPRTGGVAMLVGLGVALPVWLIIVDVMGPILWLLSGTGLVAMLSFLDDRNGVSVGVRFLGHIVGASFVVLGAGLMLPSFSQHTLWPLWVGVGLSVLFLVWMINLYNFMDGMDGLAAGMAVIGFSAFAVMGALANNLSFLVINLTIVGAAGGFLVFNFPPARIFMGDTGSATLGILAGTLCLWGAQEAVFSFWAGLLVFSPFIVDATVTLVRRILQRERIWVAHKTHYYQRLVLLGWGHRKTVLAAYILMLACAGSAMWIARSPSSLPLVFGVWVSAYMLLAVLVHILELRR